ncbi:MAG: hypothetical protein U9R15_17575, partial [Chloroflexota bacterium]|nr:hypothetical protein [Chloroflexota bacterium]
QCPAGAIHPTESESVEIGGKTATFAKLDQAACLFHHWGLSDKTSPFVPEGASAKFEPGMTMEDVVVLREKVNKRVPIYDRIRLDSRTQAICGSRGCCAACVRHLEKTGRISRRLRQNVGEEQDRADKAVITHRHVFLPDEPVPPHFLESCRQEPDVNISEHVEGVG